MSALRWYFGVAGFVAGTTAFAVYGIVSDILRRRRQPVIPPVIPPADGGGEADEGWDLCQEHYDQLVEETAHYIERMKRRAE